MRQQRAACQTFVTLCTRRHGHYNQILPNNHQLSPNHVSLRSPRNKGLVISADYTSVEILQHDPSKAQECDPVVQGFPEMKQLLGIVHSDSPAERLVYDAVSDSPQVVPGWSNVFLPVSSLLGSP